MNRIGISIAIFAFASTLGFAQEQQQAPTVTNPDPQIGQLKRMIKHLEGTVEGTVQLNRNAQIRMNNEIQALRKELAAREQMQEQAEHDRQRIEALKEGNERKERQASRRLAFIVEGISGGLLIIVGIGGFLWVRARERRNQNAAPAPTTQPQCAPLVDLTNANPRPEQIRTYFREHPKATAMGFIYIQGENELEAVVIKDVNGILNGRFPKYPNVTPCGLDKLYKTAMDLMSSDSVRKLI